MRGQPVPGSEMEEQLFTCLLGGGLGAQYPVDLEEVGEEDGDEVREGCRSYPRIHCNILLDIDTSFLRDTARTSTENHGSSPFIFSACSVA